MKTKLSITLILMCKFLIAQNYNTIPIKEEFDLYNQIRVFNTSYNPCTADPNNDAGTFGDGMSKVLEGYVAMYKATGDKAYLYKFVLQSLCMMENRHDINSAADNNEPRWTHNPSMYQDGYIIAAFSRFIYFIKLEEPSLFSETLYQFDELNPSNYAANTCYCNKFGITFSTFGQYANWLQDRVGETMWWYLTNGYWKNSLGFTQFPNDDIAANINMQIGFGRALLFNGLTAGNTNFLNKANIIANLIKGNVFFYDPCEDIFYNAPVLIPTGDNTYWWYHNGWRVGKKDCGVWYWNVPDYSGYTEFVDDMSHGAVVTWLPLDFYNFQPSTPFTTTDMIRFRNMFTKHLYDGSGGFYNAVNGTDGPISDNDPCSPNSCPHSFHKIKSLNYMPLADFDGADGTATTPNAYEIIMDFYISDITGNTNLPSEYGGQINKGHAEIVQAQWIRECPDLTLYNRKIVYDQDFRVEGTLTVAPEETSGDSYADPVIPDQTFTVEPNTTVNMVAGERIVMKPGTHIKAGSNFHAYIDPNLCSNTQKTGNPNGNGRNKNDDTYDLSNSINDTALIENQNAIVEEPNYLFDNSLNVYPNPFADNTLIQFTLQKTSNVTLTVFDSFGRPIFNQIVDRQLKEGIYNIPFSGDNLAAGFYHCILTIDNQTQLTKMMIKK